MTISAETIDCIEEGSPCPHEGCGGTMDMRKPRNCSCHISPPCSSCVDAGYECGTCGWETSPEEVEEHVGLLRRKPGSARHLSTHTRTANAYNSTPFTDCCGVAAINTSRCPNCEAEITWHDDGLAQRRREVGPGNCLMCGQKRGPIGIPGNCCC